MSAISTPIPEPIPPDPPAIAVIEPTRGPSPLHVGVFAIIALAALVAAVWLAGRSDPVAVRDPLTENLQWMFEAALTYPGADRTGAIHPAPAAALTVRDIAVADPRQGPLIVTVDVTRPDGTAERARYRIEVVRRDEAWTVTAAPDP